jgi:putative membrane protein
MLYNWVKAAHLIFVIATMASLMIYPRYKIHQLASQPGEPLFETMKSAANKLRLIVMNPSIILIWAGGAGDRERLDHAQGRHDVRDPARTGG